MLLITRVQGTGSAIPMVPIAGGSRIYGLDSQDVAELWQRPWRITPAGLLMRFYTDQ